MLNFYQKITIENKIIFHFSESIEIVSDRDKFTDTAVVKIPQQNKQFSEILQVNDKIKIELGYLQKGLFVEFEGYITSIKPENLMVLECQDASWLLKKQTIESKIFENTTYKELIEAYYTDNFNCIDAEIGTWKVGTNATLITVMQELKSKFATLCYFQNNELFVNYDLEKEPVKQIIFNSTKNVIQGSDNLQFKDNEDYTAVSYGVSPQDDGTQIEVYSYYKDASNTDIISTQEKPNGSLNELNIPNLTLAKLTELTENRLKTLYYSGLSGTISIIGINSFQHGDIAEIINKEQPKKNGKYLITAVSKKVNLSEGYTQTATLGKRLA